MIWTKTDEATASSASIVATAMKPHSALKSLLVHPKDKTDSKEGVYTTDCNGCDKFIGET